jgi:hypothetical protein
MRSTRASRLILLLVVVAFLCPSAIAKKKKPAEAPATSPSPSDTPPGAPRATMIKLPAQATAVGTGGGGKYLILHLEKLQQLGIFDVALARIVKFIPVQSNDLVFSAGSEKLFVGYKDLRQIQRYDLAKGELELTVAGPEGGIGAIATGANSPGPVLLLGDNSKRFWLMDPVTLKVQPYTSKNWGTDGSAWGPVHIHVTFDGTTAVACGGGWAGIELSTLSGNKVNGVHAGGYVNGDTHVSGDGSLVFPDKGGILRSDLATKITGIDGTPFPADDPGYSLSLFREKGKVRGKGKAHLIVFSNAEARSLVTLRDLPELDQDLKMPLAQRIHLIPSQGVLVTLGPGGDELSVRKFDLVEQLNASGVDYLFVSSTPPTHAARGQAYTYAITVLSKRGGVKSELQAGPPGMKLDADGKLHWAVPHDFGSSTASIIIQVADASGQSIFHTFTLNIGGNVTGPPVASVSSGVKPPATIQPPRMATSNPPPAATNLKPPFVPVNTNPPAVATNAKPPKVATSSNPPAAPVSEAGDITTLAEPFHEYHAAAGGRTLVFYQQRAQQLALYDAATGKALGTISLGADNARFACGMDCIVVALPDQKILQRYDLKTLKRTKSAPIPDARPIKHLGMGNASTGPMFLYFGGEMVAVDATTLEIIKHRGALPAGDPNWRFDFRVSADGSTVVTWDSYASPSNFTITHLKNGVVYSVVSPEGFSMANRKFTPTADGSLVMYETKFYNAAARPLASTITGYQNSIPTSDPRFFIAVKDSQKRRSAAAICTVTDRRILAEIDAIPDVGDTNGFDGSRCGVVHDLAGAGEPRLVFLPDSHTLAAIPVSNDRFERLHVDLNSALASDVASGNSAAQALAVVSLPPAEVVINTSYSYQIQVLPEKARVTCKVESGPPGLAVSASGLVTWKPTERPIGGKVNVILSIADAAGHEVPHAFEISVTRFSGAPTESGAATTGAIVKADEHRLELPDKEYRYAPGMSGKVLLLSGNQLALLATDGFTIEKTQTLPKSYVTIAERKNYYVALCQEPRSIDVIDKSTLKVLRSRSIAFSSLGDLALNPLHPISYVSYTEPGNGPRHHFLIFDEIAAEAHTNDNWLGEWLAISPDGDFLMAGLQETYQNGHEIIDNPDRIWIVPTYGSHDMLCRYDLDQASGIPRRVADRENVGGNGGGIRLSPDAKRVTYLSFTGYPQFSHNLGAWDPLDLSKLPVAYNIKDIATTKDLAFHPILPLVACFGKGSVTFFDRESGAKEESRIPDDQIAGEEIQRLYFSPDGKSLILETTVQGLHYLYHLPLKLSAAETRALGSLPRPDKPLEVAPPPPVPAGTQKLPKVET